jgi:Fur family peroxide stress response transcriptional regulator
MKKRPGSQEIENGIITKLREKGYRLTPQRIEIIRLLSNDRSHPGAMDIFRRVKKKAPQISMSTVYYTIDMLKKAGLIQELEFYDSDNRYDVNLSDHINLVCRKCGKIEDFTDALPFSSKIIEEKTGFQSVGMRFEYYGYCKECRAKRKP